MTPKGNNMHTQTACDFLPEYFFSSRGSLVIMTGKDTLKNIWRTISLFHGNLPNKNSINIVCSVKGKLVLYSREDF